MGSLVQRTLPTTRLYSTEGLRGTLIRVVSRSQCTKMALVIHTPHSLLINDYEWFDENDGAPQHPPRSAECKSYRMIPYPFELHREIIIHDYHEKAGLLAFCVSSARVVLMVVVDVERVRLLLHHVVGAMESPPGWRGPTVSALSYLCIQPTTDTLVSNDQ